MNSSANNFNLVALTFDEFHASNLKKPIYMAIKLLKARNAFGPEIKWLGGQ